jgi:hypothetical protein
MRYAALLLVTFQVRAADAPVIDPAAYQAHINYLASDQLKGRASGTPELDKAADYLRAQFISYGVKPIPGTDYFQEFTVPTGVRLTGTNRLTATRDGRTETLSVNSTFVPFSFSSTGTSGAAPVIFAGYGITAPEYNYDDYANLSVTGKFVLIFRHEPQEDSAQSVFAGRAETKHATFVNKAINAKNHGALGVILINDTPHHPKEGDRLMNFAEADGPKDAGVFFVQIKASTAETWLRSAGRELTALAESIDRDLQPQSFALTGLTASATVGIQHDEKKAHNVIGYIPGSTDDYVIVGAHYDHLGLGEKYSMAPNEKGRIHHGADDNASGTAAVLEIARYFASQPTAAAQPRPGLLFIAFAGEEMGLLGSGHYTNHPLLPLANARAMLNMDMIGRVTNNGRVFVNGTGTGSTLKGIVDSIAPPEGLRFDFSESLGYGGSDHESFVAKQVPVIFFFSGLHADYHKPSDTAEKIDTRDAAAIAGYVAQIAQTIATRPDRPVFQRVAAPQGDPHAGGTPVSSGYGPNFGSVPDFNEPPKGVRFADVREGTPAAKAGLKAGDILIRFDGKEIANLYDFTYALQSHRPGDEVLVQVIRANQTIEAKVLLTERR